MSGGEDPKRSSVSGIDAPGVAPLGEQLDAVYHLNRKIVVAPSAERRPRRRTAGMMTWLAWSAIALAVLVAALNAWMTWQRLAGASRRPAEPGDLEEYPPGRRSKGERDDPPEVLAELDERGYLSRTRLRMGCEAAICRTPLGARIVVGRSDLKEPQYAWDYTSVAQAQTALSRIEFTIDPERGIALDGASSGSCPAAEEPRGYLRRWKYTADGQMQRF